MSIEQLRSYKVFEMAIFDLVLAYVGVLILTPLLVWVFKKIGVKTTLTTWMWLTLPLSVVFHLAVGQKTVLTDMTMNLEGDYLIKIVLILMVFLAWRSGVIRKVK